MEHSPNNLKVRSIGIDTYRENIIFIHQNCPISRSEGFTALTRVVVRKNERKIIATLNVVYSGIISEEEVGLSKEAMVRLDVRDGDMIEIKHLKPIESFSLVRAKMYGKELTHTEFLEIITDVVSGHYSNIELASFITACSGNNLTVGEIIGLTRAMIATSEKINWGSEMILDKHSVGGLPGNRTTPIVVSIVAAAGLTIPKTSSRAITSPAGTADTVETFTQVDLTFEQIKNVVEKEKGCMAWGGAVRLSPADDVLISVERSLDLDSMGQMVASVLSKKASAGATHVLIDIPVGESAKVRSKEEALKLQYFFKAVAEQIGLRIETVITEGAQPVGRGIGPSLEAMDVISVLKNEPDAPQDLKQKAVALAGMLLEMSGRFAQNNGYNAALTILESGEAFKKFMAICDAQGGFREPSQAAYRFDVAAEQGGVVKKIDNRKLARIAKLAGAPKSPGAGIKFLAPLGRRVSKGDVLFTIFSETRGELEYVRSYVNISSRIIEIA